MLRRSKKCLRVTLVIGLKRFNSLYPAFKSILMPLRSSQIKSLSRGYQRVVTVVATEKREFGAVNEKVREAIMVAKPDDFEIREKQWK